MTQLSPSNQVIEEFRHELCKSITPGLNTSPDWEPPRERSSDPQLELEIQTAQCRFGVVLQWRRPDDSDEISAVHALYYYIRSLVLSAIPPRPRDEKERIILMSFRGEQARAISIWMQMGITSSEPLEFYDAAMYRHLLKRLFVHFSRNTGALPPTLFLNGVGCDARVSLNWGAFGEVFEAYYDDRVVALKRLKPARPGSDPQRPQRAFCTEALVWQQLDHKNVLPFLGVDSVTFAPFPCMVSPWMENGNIMVYMSRFSTLPFPIDPWIQQIAEGLEYLHSQKVVHGDLRGANILIDNDMAVRLSDFGLSMFTDSSTASWGSTRGGTTRWQAPECFRGSFSHATTKTDVYAFGCTCLEIYTRKRPFHLIETDRQVVAHILLGHRPTRPEVVEVNQARMWNTIEMCWNEDPRNRPEASFLAQRLFAEDHGDALDDTFEFVLPPQIRFTTPQHLIPQFRARGSGFSPSSPLSQVPNSPRSIPFGSPFSEFILPDSPETLFSSPEMIQLPIGSLQGSPQSISLLESPPYL